MTATPVVLTPKPISRAAFAAFGDVIQTDGAERFTINNGQTRRYHDLARLETSAEDGRPLLSIFETRPWPAPPMVAMMERHPIGSQAFFPLVTAPYLAVVAPPGAAPGAGDLRAYVCAGVQGVNFAAGVWHHPLMPLARAMRFLVIDRGGPGENCDCVHFPETPARIQM